MPTPYETVENAIKAALIAPDAEENPSPLKDHAVKTYGCQLTDADLVEEAEKLKNSAPAALVFYYGGQAVSAAVPATDEMAEFHVVVIGYSTGATQVLRHPEKGLYALLELVRSRCNGLTVPHSLNWVGNRRVPSEWPITAAAMTAVFQTRMWHG